MVETIVVTRHPGLVAYLVEKGLVAEGVAVIAHASPTQVEGKHVIGVLPLSLAALAVSVTEVAMDIPPGLRGQELTLDQVREFARGIVTYVVTAQQ